MITQMNIVELHQGNHYRICPFDSRFCQDHVNLEKTNFALMVLSENLRKISSMERFTMDLDVD